MIVILDRNFEDLARSLMRQLPVDKLPHNFPGPGLAFNNHHSYVELNQLCL